MTSSTSLRMSRTESGMELSCVETEGGSGGLETQTDRADRDDVAVVDAAVAAQSFAVQEGAVRRPEVIDHETAPGTMDLGVVAAGVAVGDHDPAVGEAADQIAALAELDPVAGRHDDRARAPAGLALLDLGRDAEAARLERVVDPQVDRDRAHEVVPLFAGVLTHRFHELGAQGVLDVGEAGVIVGGEQDPEIVGHEPLALDVDGAVIVHLADETAPQLDRPDGVAGAAEHAFDHTL